MPDKDLKVAFISHESSLSGAPLLLLNLVKLLRKHGICECLFILKRGGTLDHLFIQQASTIVLKPSDYQVSKSFPGKVLDFLSYKKRLRSLQKILGRFDIIVSNTVANGQLLSVLAKCRKPIITYVHELESAMLLCDRLGDTSMTLKYSNAFFSPTAAVTDNLISNHNITPSIIYPLNYHFEASGPEILQFKEEKRSSFLEKYGIPAGKFYVVGMGSANLRKGIDMFVEICEKTIAMDKDVHFVWIGDFLDTETKTNIEQKVENRRLVDHLTITGFIANSTDNLLPFDIFALTSREDPYPLVVLEAAFLEIPSICFEGTGGIGSFVEKDAGFQVKDYSTTQFAERIVELKGNRMLLEEKGKNARKKALRLHSDDKNIIEQFRKGVLSILQNQ
jgi:glycosyltransferase involved in cell wall biosynthesis